MSQSHFTLSFFPLQSPADAKVLAEQLPPMMPELFQTAVPEAHVGRQDFLGKEMTNEHQRRRMLRRVTLLLLWSVGLWSSVATARYIGPTAHGYSFHASALPNEIFLSGDLTPETYPTTATLIVHVRDVNQVPVEGLPVTFQLGSQCQGVAALSAQRAVTHNGKASVTLTTATTTGVCRIMVGVDNVTQELLVSVSPVPDDYR